MQISNILSPENGLAGALVSLVLWYVRTQATALMKRLDKQDERFEEHSEDIKNRTARLEYILIGDEGKNGVRQAVKDLKEQLGEVGDVLVQQNTDLQTRMGEHFIWRTKVDAAILALQGKGVRKNTGRRQADKR